METHEYFAYGSNLDPARMATRCPGAHARRPGRLPGHELAFNKISLERDGTGYANAEPARGRAVEGALYTLDLSDLMRLDKAEGHPHHYSRRLMAVEEADGTRTAAWVYFATPDWKADRLVPRPDYVAHLLAGADVCSPAYRAAIEATLAT